MNETGLHNVTVPASTIENTRFNYNNDTGVVASTTHITVSGVVWHREGLAGNCVYFDGSDDYIVYNPSSDDTLSDITSEASFVAHIIPDSSVAGATNYILYGDPIRLWLDATTGKINATVYWDYSDSARGITLTSGSIIPIDGETPTSIIVTLDKNLKHGNAKLFLNGRLEDQSGLCLASATAAAATNNWGSDDDVFISTNPFYVGFTSNSFHGRIEEVVVYNKAIYPILPQQQEYVFKKPLQEIQGSAPVSYAARLFIKDYHNIRGTVPTQVASSSQISYTKAGFDLTG